MPKPGSGPGKSGSRALTLDAPSQKSVAIISNAVYLQISKTQLSCYDLEKKIRTLLSFAENLLHHLYSQGVERIQKIMPVKYFHLSPT